MTIIINISVDDEIEKKELEQYLIKQAKKFIAQKKGDKSLKLVESDYDDMPEQVKENFNELFDEEGNVKNLDKFGSVEDVF